MKSELVLLVNRDKENYPQVLDQLSSELDKSSNVGNGVQGPSMIICTKPIWIEIEGELQEALIARFGKKLHGYDKVTATSAPGRTEPPSGYGFNALSYRGIPIVAMDAGDDNIISSRLKGHSNV
jgi:hypothetical protein